eukprot:UN34493
MTTICFLMDNMNHITNPILLNPRKFNIITPPTLPIIINTIKINQIITDDNNHNLRKEKSSTQASKDDQKSATAKRYV